MMPLDLNALAALPWDLGSILSTHMCYDKAFPEETQHMHLLTPDEEPMTD